MNCAVQFIKKLKEYERFSLSKLTSPFSAKNSYPRLRSIHGFICKDCRSLLYKKTVLHKPTKKRKSITQDENSSPPSSPAHQAKRTHRDTPQKLNPFQRVEDRTFRDRACLYLNNSKYVSCFRTHITKSDTAKAALLTVASTDIEKEVARVSQCQSESQILSLAESFSVENVGSFDWAKVVEETKNKLPVLLLGCIISLGQAVLQKGSEGPCWCTKATHR